MSAPTPDLAGLRALAEGATPGPWHQAFRESAVYSSAQLTPSGGIYGSVATVSSSVTAAYIAAVSPDVLTALLDRLEAAERTHRDLTRRLGFGDNITEPMADNDTIVAWFDEQGRDAAEWRESQHWRVDCHLAGHPDDEDCYEHDPARSLEAAESLAASRLDRIHMLVRHATENSSLAPVEPPQSPEQPSPRVVGRSEGSQGLCADLACGACDESGCRYPGWRMCRYPTAPDPHPGDERAAGGEG